MYTAAGNDRVPFPLLTADHGTTLPHREGRNGDASVSGKQAKRLRASERDIEVSEMKPVVVKFIRDALGKLRREYARRLRIIRRNDPEGVAALGDVLTAPAASSGV